VSYPYLRKNHLQPVSYSDFGFFATFGRGSIDVSYARTHNLFKLHIGRRGGVKTTECARSRSLLQCGFYTAETKESGTRMQDFTCTQNRY
jgi:hypothetical protein